MKRYVFIFFLILLSISMVEAQTIEELYSKKNHQDIIKFESKAEDLTGLQLYYVGYSFFRLENSKKAIEMYNKAIAKGLDKDFIYLQKGLAFIKNKNFNEATTACRMAVKKNPDGQKNLTVLGNCYYMQNQYDTALYYFRKARKLKYELGDAYFKIPYILKKQKKLDESLKENYVSVSLINKIDDAYPHLFSAIGYLEFHHARNYAKSVKAYSDMLSLVPKEYGYYPALIKSCYANKEYHRGDSVFNILKEHYTKGDLPEIFDGKKAVSVDEFKVDGHRVTVSRHFKPAQRFPDTTYEFFFWNKKGNKVKRKIHSEKTRSGGHALCEWKGAKHFNYGGYTGEVFDYVVYKNILISILSDNKVKKK